MDNSPQWIYPAWMTYLCKLSFYVCIKKHVDVQYRNAKKIENGNLASIVVHAFNHGEPPCKVV